MGFVVVSELCRVSMGVVTGMGVSLGLTGARRSWGRGTLAQAGALAAGSRHLRQDRRVGRSPNPTPGRMRSAA
jgi:hypothetical protein